jgi:hypothetical protein
MPPAKNKASEVPRIVASPVGLLRKSCPQHPAGEELQALPAHSKKLDAD